MHITCEQYIARPEAEPITTYTHRILSAADQAASTFNQSSILPQYSQNRNFHLRWVDTHHNSKFRLSENILGPSLKVAQSANPRNIPVLLAVGLNHNFQI